MKAVTWGARCCATTSTRHQPPAGAGVTRPPRPAVGSLLTVAERGERTAILNISQQPHGLARCQRPAPFSFHLVWFGLVLFFISVVEESEKFSVQNRKQLELELALALAWNGVHVDYMVRCSPFLLLSSLLLLCFSSFYNCLSVHKLVTTIYLDTVNIQLTVLRISRCSALYIDSPHLFINNNIRYHIQQQQQQQCFIFNLNFTTF